MKVKAKIQIISAMAAFGTIGAFVRNIPLGSGELALYRAVIAAAALFIWQRCTGRNICFSQIKKELPLIVVSGAAIGVNWILFFEAYRHTTIALATLSYYFAPVIVTAASSFIFKETLTRKQIFCFLMSALGLVLVIGVSSGEGRDITGILFGLGAAFFYASAVLLNKGIKTVSGLNRTFLQFVAAIAVLAPYAAVKEGFNLAGLSPAGAVNLLIVGIFHTGICYTMYFSSLRYLKGQEASLLSYIDPLAAVCVSAAVLGEPISLMQVFGGCMILGFTILNEMNLGRESSSAL